MADPNYEAAGLRVHDARDDHLDALAALRGTYALHADRVRDAGLHELHYLVVLARGRPVGFGVLVLDWPEHWPPPEFPDRLPKMIDLWVSPDHRSAGAGTALIRRMEEISAERGSPELFLSVNPGENPRAEALYRRLGYEPVDPEPYLARWEFTDSGGTFHSGEDLVIDLAKRVLGR
jgi:ribosomal protein S18 acetylase RimI-like enzyme